MGFPFNGVFTAMSIMSVLIFTIVITLFIVAIVKGITTWNKNNHSPRLTVDASVVSRRTDITTYHHANGGDTSGAHGYHTSSSTSYYITFQVESGDRMEFLMDDNEYALLAEGDQGRLSFQGTRYLGFERIY